VTGSPVGRSKVLILKPVIILALMAVARVMLVVQLTPLGSLELE
jgi:hypothetical protein